MEDHVVSFQLRKSATDAGYDFVVTGGLSDIVIARNVPLVKDALNAIRDAFTAPLVDKDRLDIMEESTAAIGGLMDRLADVESSLDATKAQLAETNAALVRMMSAQPHTPSTTTPLGMSYGMKPERLAATLQEPPVGAPRIVEEGFAGTFRRPLADYVHGNERGHFAGGAFRPGGARAKQGLEPPQAPGVGDDEP